MPGSTAMGLAASFSLISMISLASSALFALAVPYVVMRLGTEGRTDPQLGTKVGLQFFFSLSVLLGLMGLTIMTIDLLGGDDPVRVQQQPLYQPNGRPQAPAPSKGWFNAAQRTGLAMVLSGVLLAGLHYLLARMMTTRENWRRIRRMFAGWSFAIKGMVLMCAVTAMLILFLQEDSFGGSNYTVMKTVFGIMVVWLPAWLVQLYILKDLIRQAPPPMTANQPIDVEIAP